MPVASPASARPSPQAQGPSSAAQTADVSGRPAQTPSPAVQQAASAKQVAQDAEHVRAKLDEAIGRLYEQAQQGATNVGFRVDVQSKQLVVLVTNKETGELIRQIPAEVVLRLARSVEDMRGLLVDERR